MGGRELERRIRRADLLVLFTDFDGTLAPIVPRPEDAAIDPATASVLRRLAQHPRVRVAIVSGRSLPDLKRRARVPGAYVAGSHGLSIAGPGYRFVHPGARTQRRAADALVRSLEKALTGTGGVEVELKEFSVACHFRRAPAASVPRILAAVRRVLRAEPGIDPASWRVLHGKRVLEILPVAGWNKGSCAALLLSRFRSRARRPVKIFPIAIGDDLTDRDLFAAAGSAGLTVAVGRARLRADRRLAGQRSVRPFLERLCAILDGRESA